MSHRTFHEYLAEALASADKKALERVATYAVFVNGVRDEMQAAGSDLDIAVSQALAAVTYQFGAHCEVLYDANGKGKLRDASKGKSKKVAPYVIQLGVKDRDRDVKLGLFEVEGTFDPLERLVLDTIGSTISTAIITHRLTQHAEADALSRLWSRWKFEDRLHYEMRQVQRNGGKLAAVAIDIDKFKGHNDTYGHGFGDTVITGVGGIIRECIREIDTAGRIGGDEMAILMPETSAEDASTVARRVLQRVLDHPFMSGDTAIPVTLSIGVAGYQQPQGSVKVYSEGLGKLLMAAADDRLYDAKERGRNNVCWNTPIQPKDHYMLQLLINDAKVE